MASRCLEIWLTTVLQRKQSFNYIPQMGDIQAVNSLSELQAEYFLTKLHQT